jgi:hypothetical protein
MPDIRRQFQIAHKIDQITVGILVDSLHHVTSHTGIWTVIGVPSALEVPAIDYGRIQNGQTRWRLEIDVNAVL